MVSKESKIHYGKILENVKVYMANSNGRRPGRIYSLEGRAAYNAMRSTSCPREIAFELKKVLGEGRKARKNTVDKIRKSSQVPTSERKPKAKQRYRFLYNQKYLENKARLSKIPCRRRLRCKTTPRRRINGKTSFQVGGRSDVKVDMKFEKNPNWESNTVESKVMVKLEQLEKDFVDLVHVQVPSQAVIAESTQPCGPCHDNYYDACLLDREREELELRWSKIEEKEHSLKELEAKMVMESTWARRRNVSSVGRFQNSSFNLCGIASRRGL
jgi:hypothetical protein